MATAQTSPSDLEPNSLISITLIGFWASTTYALSGADAAKFDIDATTGQLYTKDGEKYDRETKASYLVTVTATDSAGQSDTVEVLILVGNEDEPPLKPGTPVVTQSPINSADLVVTWTAPDNEGRPPITDYLITYSLAIGGLGAATVRTSELTATLTNLERLTRYEIGVRATNAEGQGESSSAVYGTTGLGGRCVTPTLPGRSALYRATLTAKEYSRTYSGIGKEVYGHGFLDSVGALSPRAFTSSSTDYEIKGAFLFDGFAAGQFAFLGYAADTLVLTLDRPLSEDDKDELRLHVCATTFNFFHSIRHDYGPTEVDYVWQSSGLDWSAVAPRFLYISRSTSESRMSPRDETVTERSPPENALIASFSRVPAEHDGASQFFVNFHLSEEPDGLSYRTVHNGLFDVTGGEIVKAKRLTRGKNNGWQLDIVPAGLADVTLKVRATTACDVAPGVCTADGRMLTERLLADIPGPVTLSVADATVQEAAGARLEFVVTLSRPRSTWTSVQWGTSDGTAYAGYDYTSGFDNLVFLAGETTKTASVAVIDDSHNEGSETMELTLHTPTPSTVKLADASATGTIINTDAMPQAWIARFGRTVAEQVLEAVESRMRAPRTPGVEVSLAGHRVGGGARDGAARAEERNLTDWLRSETDPERRRGYGARRVTERDLLTGSSFALTGGEKSSGFYSLWGRGAVSRFDGRDGALSLDGEVTSGMLGADWTRGAVTAGLVVSHSLGEGAYRGAAGGPANGAVSSSLTGFYPWGRYALSERLSVWGVAGYGEGTLTLTPEDQAPTRTDLDLMMAAAGLRGVLVAAPETGGFELAVKTDARDVRTSTAKANGSDGGKLEAVEAEVTRLRLGLEGSRPFRFEDGATLTPSVEIGVRHDGGDAETGFGVDIGGGIAWSDPKRGLSAELRGRGLMSHEAKGFRERGFSGALGFVPTPSSDRGLKLTMSRTVGAQASGGTAALLSRGTLAGLAANDNGDGRFEMKLGYGLAAFGDRFTMTPEIGFGFSNGGRDYSLGWRLAREARYGGALELLMEARRRESANDNADAPPVHEVGVRLTSRF